MKLNRVARKNPNIVARVIGEEIILVPIYKHSDEINCIYSLNKSAALVWQMLDGKNNIARIKERLSKEFDGTIQEIERELESFLKDLEEAKAIIYK